MTIFDLLAVLYATLISIGTMTRTCYSNMSEMRVEDVSTMTKARNIIVNYELHDDCGSICVAITSVCKILSSRRVFDVSSCSLKCSRIIGSIVSSCSTWTYIQDVISAGSGKSVTPFQGVDWIVMLTSIVSEISNC